MCLGAEAIIGAITSLVGTAASMSAQQEAEARAQRQAEARNRELDRTLVKNDALAKESRERFNTRIRQANKDAMDADQEKATQDREQALEDSVIQDPAKGAEAAPISGSAPAVVKSELARRMSEAIGQGKEQAKRLATLSGYGDAWLKQGFLDQSAGRDLGVTGNLAAGNMAILPYAQDFAEYKAAYGKGKGSTPTGQAMAAPFYGGR